LLLGGAEGREDSSPKTTRLHIIEH
jgi:hypothetical protein